MSAGHLKNWQPALLKGDKLRQWAQAVAETEATRTLLGPRTAETAIDLARPISEGAQHAIDMSGVKNQRACHKGCPGCCHAMISITAPEVFAIADYLHTHKSPEDVARVRRRAEEIAEKSRTMEKVEFAKAMLWCPLLDSDLTCSVYPIRPICCRAWNSLSLEACHDCYFGNHVSDQVPVDEHAHTVGQGVRSGFTSAIEAAGLDGHTYELSSILVTALDTPDASERWVKGESVFEHGHRT